MSRTRPITVIVLVALGATAGFLAQLGLASMSQPKLRPEYTLAATLFLLAVLTVALAIPVRRSSRGVRAGPVDPFYATRVVILAKASGLAGALLTGAGTGLLIELLVRSGTPGGDAFVRVILALVAALVLLVAGLVAEWMCTVPPAEGDDADHAAGSVES